jgi:LCP family protein required for cell wall assembly
LAWTVGGTLVPGLGLVRARHRVIGTLALICTATVLAAAVYVGLHRQSALGILASPEILRYAAMSLVVVAFAWAALSVATYWAICPSGLTTGRRLIAALLVGTLVFGIAAPLSVAAQYAVSQANLVSNIFAGADDPVSVTAPTFSPGTATDPWANTERVNVLLLGYDRGMGRDEDEGGLTDTIMVASIDTRSGNAVLASLPRNTARMPFPRSSPLYSEFPRGWYNGYDPDDLEWMLNTMYRNLPTMVDPDVIGPTRDLGADAVKLSVGQALGLHIDYYVLVNIDGAMQLVDAMGGITVNINKEIPVDGGWLDPGPNVWLNGWDAVQYARSRRADDDFHRMARQRCVMNAIIKQADFGTMLTRYEAIAAASSQLVSTDVPATMLPALLNLALRVKGGTLTSMQFGGEGDFEFDAAYPDFDMMAERMQAAIDASIAPPPTVDQGSSDSGGASDPGTTAPGGLSTGVSSGDDVGMGDVQDLSDACAYHPE